MPNPFCYAELHTFQPESTKEFYGSLFDWEATTKETPMGLYTEINTKEGFPGGLLTVQEGSSHWVPYIQVEDLELSTSRAKELGANAVYELCEVPDQGRFSLLVDPGGATFGLWQCHGES